jgi:hypothetical protein
MRPIDDANRYDKTMRQDTKSSGNSERLAVAR